MCQNIIWKRLYHPDIKDGYLISPHGDIRYAGVDESKAYHADYHSSNGFDYAIFINKYLKPQLFPIDEILSTVYIPIPNELQNKRVTVHHIDGNNRNNDIDNLEWIEDIEEWKEITDPDIKCNNYWISSEGRIKNLSSNTIVNGFKSRGYSAISLRSAYDDSQYIQRHVNRLVASAFIEGNSPSRCIVNHIDGNKLNNHVKNLEWVTYSENSRHSYMMGLTKRRIGDDSPFAKISEDIARKIWLLLIDDTEALNGRPKTHGSPKKVMEYMIDDGHHVTCTTIGNIKKNKKWGNTVFDKDYIFEDFKISEDIARKIWLLLIDDTEALNGRPKTHGSPKKVMEYMIDEGTPVTVTKIYSIKNGVSWRSVTDTLPRGNLHNMTCVIDEDIARKIWLLLIDDTEALNGRPKTHGSPKKVMEYMIDEAPNINIGIIVSIKLGSAWTHVTGLNSQHRRNKHE